MAAAIDRHSELFAADHHFDLNQYEEAYDEFAGAAETDALKIVLTQPAPASVQTNDGGT